MAEPTTTKRKGLPSLRFRAHIAAIFPEHLGDIFTSLLVIAMGIGAGIFWLTALLPTAEQPPEDSSVGIPKFFDEELDDVIKILKARTEASTAPVVPPARDPF